MNSTQHQDLSSVSVHESSKVNKHSQVMVPNLMPTLLTSSACAVVAMLVLFSGPLATNFSLLCGGFMSSAASSVQIMLIAALRLLGVSTALLCLYCACKLPMPAAVCRDQLFPLGLLIGFSGGSVLAGLSCVTDPTIHFGVLFLGFFFLLHKSFVVVDNSPSTSAVMVTFADAAVQVQFIPAPPVPSMQVPVLLQS